MTKSIAVALIALVAASVVSAQDIMVGQSVALSGPNADIGRDMRDGALAVFAKVNAKNELGRKVQLVTLDNANNRQRAAENTQQLLQQGAMVLFGYNSATNVYTIRASYRDEAAKILEAKRTVGAVKTVVLHYDDEVGRSNYESVAEAFAAAGMARPKGVAVKRGAPMDAAAASALLKDAPHYVLATTQYNVVGDFLKAATDRGTPTPVAALSFVNPDELAESLGALARGTVVSQVIPSPRGANQVALPVVKECAEALDALNGGKLNYTTLESCIAAKALVAALKKAGPKPTRESVLAAVGTLGRIDLGGVSLNFAAANHQASNAVELTILSRGNRFVQ